jgi:hypothetical protein
VNAFATTVSVFRNSDGDVPPIEVAGIAWADRNIAGVPVDVPPVPPSRVNTSRGTWLYGASREKRRMRGVGATCCPDRREALVRRVLLGVPMYWRCLLDGDLRSQAAGALGDIVGVVARDEDVSGGLEGGVGRACLLAYAGQAREDAALIEGGSALLDGAVEALRDAQGMPGLWGGLADTRFLLAHVAAGDEADHAIEVIDEALIESLGGTMRRRLDLIGGLAGIGVAALEDPARGRGAALATRVLEILEGQARADEHGVAWFTPPEQLPEWQRARCPDGHWNLGLAHGIPGVIGFLAEMVRADVETERARALLAGAVPWLLAAAPPRSPARFPSWRGRAAPNEPARLAWCYGDAGVVVTLLAAARAVGQPAWESEARTMARAMATRTFETSGVLDMGICHGAAGVAHIFNRLYQATGDEVLGDAARRWFAQLLAMRRPGDAVAGFPARNHVDGADVWIADGGVVMGATGVGLVLLAATTELEPAWDRALLCNVAPIEAHA